MKKSPFGPYTPKPAPKNFNENDDCPIYIEKLGKWNPLDPHGPVANWKYGHFTHSDCLNKWMSQCSIQRYWVLKSGGDPNSIQDTKTCPVYRA